MSYRFLVHSHKLIFTVLAGLIGEVFCWAFFFLTHEQGRGRINYQYLSSERQINTFSLAGCLLDRLEIPGWFYFSLEALKFCLSL